jgi:hypothetical protein
MIMSKLASISKRSVLCAIVCSLLASSADRLEAGEFETSFRQQVGAFLDTLDQAQAAACLLGVDHQERWQMKYPGAKRPGLSIGQLTVPQRAEMEKALRMVLSDSGWAAANEVAKQDAKEGEDGLGKYWLSCFGDPRKGGNFAFRVAEHHLTVVQLEVADGETTEFGPVLLGANPPNLWREDEKALMQLFKKLGTKKALIEGKKAIASKPMQEQDGVLFPRLNAEAQTAVKEAWEKRLSFFTPAIRSRINRLYESRGGWEKSRVAFYHEAPEKRCIDGGRWDFKCGIPGKLGLVWDFEASRGHIHMSLWVK